jgi:hypothetical protein
MNLTPKNNIEEFNQFLFEQIDLNIYQHKFLNDYVDKAIKGLKPLYELSVLNTSQNNGWILILHGEMLLVYGENWNEIQIKEINEVFDLNKYTNYTLAGDNELIDKLIEFYKPINFEVEKRRILYHTNEITNFDSEGFKIRLGSFDELNELAVMLQEYYHEEYDGLNDKTIKEMRQRIISVIQAEKIYVLLDMNETLLSFCTIIDPDIGILFTNREHRKKGYGKIILSYCSQLLLQKNEAVYVMTDRDKLESNIVCEAVGFKPYFNYTMTQINCG